MDANLGIVKGHCSKCDIDGDGEIKFCLRIMINGNAVLICVYCLNDLVKMITTFQKGEEKAKEIGML